MEPVLKATDLLRGRSDCGLGCHRSIWITATEQAGIYADAFDTDSHALGNAIDSLRAELVKTPAPTPSPSDTPVRRAELVSPAHKQHKPQ